MQDRYAGDIGDYSKYGLLRWLIGMRRVDDGPDLRLGILWYLFDGAEPQAKNDGRFIEYLLNPSRVERSLEGCDPELYPKLQRMATAAIRSIEDVPVSRVLPEGTLYYDSPLNFDHTPQGVLEAKRHAWIEAGLAAVANTDIVCVDPDNGMEVPGTGRHSRKGPKYVYYDDLQSCWQRGQSLIIYQHANRVKDTTVESQAAKRAVELRDHLPGANPVALRFRRRISRVYFVLAQPDHSDLLEMRIRSFSKSAWCTGSQPHFEVVEL